jgi:hypothetical protein
VLLCGVGFGSAVAGLATAGGLAGFATQADSVAASGTTSCFALKMCAPGVASARAGVA